MRWSKLQAGKGVPVRLAYGSALRIDAAQGITSKEYISALLGGTGGVTGSKTYVVESRHERTTWMVLAQAAERRGHARQRRGMFTHISEADRASRPAGLREPPRIRDGPRSHPRGLCCIAAHVAARQGSAT